MTPHKQRLRIAHELREAEKARRAELTNGLEKAEIRRVLLKEPSMLDTLLAKIPFQPIDLGTPEEWRNAIYMKVQGGRPRKYPNAPITAPRLRFYPTIQTPEYFKDRSNKYDQFWNGCALVLQPEAQRIREEYAAAFKTLNTRFEAEGKLVIDGKKKTFVNGTKEEYEKEIEAVHKEINKVGRMVKACKPVNDFITATLVNATTRKMIIDKNKWGAGTIRWLNYVVAYYPSDVTRQVHEAFTYKAQIKDLSEVKFRFVGRGENIGGRGSLDIFSDAPAQKNPILQISEAYNPVDHHGRRAGKTSEQAQLRLVTVTAPKSGKQQMFGNVLFDSQAIGKNSEKRLLKQFRLHSDKDAWGREQWWFIPTLEHIEASRIAKGTGVAGCDIGWRTDDDGIQVLHVRTEIEYLIYCSQIKDNCWIRRHNRKFPQFEIHLNDLEDFQSYWDKKMDGFKALVESTLKAKPPKFKFYKAPQLISLFTPDHRTGKLRHPELTTIRSEFEVWNANNIRRQQIYNHVVTQHKADLRCQYRAMFFDLAARDIGTIVMEDLGLKELAEKETVGKYNWERHIGNVSKYNRHKASLSNLIRLFKELGYKCGVKVLFKNPRNTTRRCNSCGHINSKETVSWNKKFFCEACKVEIIRDENSCLNIRDMGLQNVEKIEELKVFGHLKPLVPTPVYQEDFLPTPPPATKKLEAQKA